MSTFQPIIDSLITWLKQDWLMKLGASFVLVSVLWLLFLGISERTIPGFVIPCIGLAISAIFHFLGYRERNKMEVYSQVMIATGIAIGVASLSSGYLLYGFNATLTLVLTGTLLVSNILLSIQNNSRYIAIYTALLLYGLVGWSWSKFGTEFASILLFATNALCIVILFWKGWRELVTVSLLASLLFTVYAFVTGWPIWVYLVLTIGYFAATLLSAIREKDYTNQDIFNAFLVVILHIYWLSNIGDNNVLALVYFVFGIINLLSAFLVRRLHPGDQRYYIQFVAFAVSNVISLVLWSDQLNILAVPALAFEILAAWYVSRTIWKDKYLEIILLKLQYIPMGITALFLASLIYNTTFSGYGFDLNTFAKLGYLLPASLAMSAILTIQSYFIYKNKSVREANSTYLWWTEVLAIMTGYLSIYSLLSLFLNTTSELLTIKVIMYLLFTIGGLVALWFNQNYQSIRAKIYGWLLLAMVIVNLLLKDFWEMPTFWRIATFMGVGILFISSAYIFEKKPVLKSK